MLWALWRLRRPGRVKGLVHGTNYYRFCRRFGAGRTLRHGVSCVPITISFGDRDYQENVTLSKAEFYALLQSEKLPPRTAQPSPYEFINAYTRRLNVTERYCSHLNRSQCLPVLFQIASRHTVDSNNICALQENGCFHPGVGHLGCRGCGKHENRSD